MRVTSTFNAKGHCWLKANAKGVHMVGCVQCHSHSKAIESCPFAFAFLIKALSLLLCGVVHLHFPSIHTSQLCVPLLLHCSQLLFKRCSNIIVIPLSRLIFHSSALQLICSWSVLSTNSWRQCTRNNI